MGVGDGRGRGVRAWQKKKSPGAFFIAGFSLVIVLSWVQGLPPPSTWNARAAVHVRGYRVMYRDMNGTGK
jgi:hypothetical protein